MAVIRTPTTWLLAALAVTAAQASLIDEDEGRIEALVRTERAVRDDIRAQAEAQVAEPPAPVVAKAIAPPVSELSDDDWLAKAAKNNGTLTFDDLSRSIGRRVTVVTSGERVHRGIVVAVAGSLLTLRVAQSGGGATYTLKRDQITRIDPR